MIFTLHSAVVNLFIATDARDTITRASYKQVVALTPFLDLRLS